MSFLDKTGLARFWEHIISLANTKVDKIDGKSLSTNDYTTAEKEKLASISDSAEVNQNAFSNIVVGSTTISADSKTDTLTLTGSNVTLTPNATSDSIQIAVASGSTSAKGIVQLTNSTSSTSTTTAATPNSVKLAYDLANTANTAATNAQTTADSKADASHNHNDSYDAKGSASDALASAKEYTDTKTSGLASTSSVNTAISTHNTSTSAHNDIRVLITDLTTKLNNFLDVDDTTTDQLSEVITLINNNKGTLESLTTSKVNVSDIIDNLTTASTTKVLSANQGVAIKTLIDELEERINDIQDVVDQTATIDYVDEISGDIWTELDNKLNVDDYVVDETMDESSTNPVSNAAVTSVTNELYELHTEVLSELSNYFPLDGGTMGGDVYMDGFGIYDCAEISGSTVILQSDGASVSFGTADGTNLVLNSDNTDDGNVVVSGVSTPTEDTDAANKSYVDATVNDVVSGAVSDIQTQLNGKQATITGGASTITSSNLTASRVLISNASGKVAVSGATSTELGYLSGVTSAIQTQLDNKVATSTLSSYYTKTEVDNKGYLTESDIENIEFITVDDIDTICGAAIVSASEVSF